MDYKLLDSGDGNKLECFGPVTLIRPSSVAVWPKSKPNLWSQAQLQYIREGEKGVWKSFKRLPEEWEISCFDVRCLLKRTPFGHLGIFPEHMGFWPALQKAIQKHEGCQVLNLFAYTGVGSIFAAKCGARVTHVDGSQAAVRWAQRNVEKNTFPDKRIFWVVEDVISFLKKEIRRNKKYRVILLDPPTYGRGPDGEVFKIDRDLFSLLSLCSQLIANDASYFLLTSHTPGHTPEFLKAIAKRSLSNLSSEAWSCGESFCGEGVTALPSGSFVQWSA
ncbi:class I SAM-dependent methyltransferase [Candidatus Chlamydia corallus]|uniref:class I SAM-dependent methyltransferase n=1 Tax=Candidatus Chlamydia corallus TaxID=2038470 RepID=UPI000C2FA771|nr:class I SAM-dependent methyltransferase [Candidatus Chlamydia corallus]